MKTIPKGTDIAAQLATLRDYTRRTGLIHEGQTQQLAIWPRMMFPHSTKTECRLSVEGRRVEVHILQTRGRAPVGQPKRTKVLAANIQLLLGEEWEVVIVYGNNERVFERLKPVPTDKYAGTDFEAGAVTPKAPWKWKNTPA